MNRTVLLTALLAVYVGFLGRGAIAGLVTASRFDPLASQPASVEQLIVARRFADALARATDLHARYPTEPLVSFWLAQINHGLGQPRAEADAWDDYVRWSKAPAEACPAWPAAHARLGDDARAQAASERCRGFARQ